MSLSQSIFIDNILFIITTIYITIWVLKKNIIFKEKLAYLLLFIIFNSSYNIMVKPIHDNNMIIFRTFIWRYKIIGPLGIMDLIFIILFITFLVDIIKNIKYNKLINLIYIREFIFILIGITSFFINKGYTIDSSKFFIECKGIIYFFVIITLTLKYLKRSIKDVDYMRMFTFILATGFISTLVFNNYYLWVRYGQVVKIIDQEDAYTISMICIYYYLFKSLKHKKIKYFLLFTVFFLQNLLCIYKLNIVYMIISIILLFTIIKKTKVSYFVSNILILCVIAMSIIGIDSLKEIASSNAIYTRVYQSIDFMTEMVHRGSYATTFGLGMGTPYYSEFDIGDGGEIKAIDKQFGNYRFAVQTPILGVVKYIGIAGFIINMTLIFIITVTMYRYIRVVRNNLSPELISLTTMFILNLITGTTSFSTYGTLPILIFNAFIIGRISLQIKELSKNYGENTNEYIINK